MCLILETVLISIIDYDNAKDQTVKSDAHDLYTTQ